MSFFPIFVKTGGAGDQFAAGYVDERGQTVIPATYRGAGRFSEGLGSVQIGDKWAIIKPSGTVLSAAFSDRKIVFSEGRATFSEAGKCGLIDKAGKVVLQPTYYLIDDFREGLAWTAKIGAWMDKPRTHAFIDAHGNVQIPFSFDDARGFRAGLAAVKVNGLWGFIQSNGAFEIPAMYESAVGFSEGLARVQSEGRWGFIDERNTFLIAARFDGAMDFKEGLAPVRTGNCWGNINHDGDYVVPPEFSRLGACVDGLIRVEQDGRVGYLDSSGEERVPRRFCSGRDFERGCAWVETREEVGYIDFNGDWIWKSERVDIGSALML